MNNTIHHRTVTRLASALAASTFSLTLAAVTFNEDTIALYAFDGKTAGESAFGGSGAETRRTERDESPHILCVCFSAATSRNALLSYTFSHGAGGDAECGTELIREMAG